MVDGTTGAGALTDPGPEGAEVAVPAPIWGAAAGTRAGAAPP